MRILLLPCLLFLLLTSCAQSDQKKESSPPADTARSKATQLIHNVLDAVGGKEALKKLRDVEFEYTYESFDGFADVSTERYLFDGEYSWAEYTRHKNAVMTTTEGVVTQGFDGKASWVAVDGKLVDDDRANAMSGFLRKTNLYWFCMNFKLLDPGVNHEYLGQRTVNEVLYEIVKVTFDPGVGDKQNDFVLYINTLTKLVDQLLFTVRDFGQENPLLMRIKYEEASGVKLPVHRKYAPANWQGELTSDEGWTRQSSKNIRFNNGFTPADFARPQ